jgi:uncharacterized protein
MRAFLGKMWKFARRPLPRRKTFLVLLVIYLGVMMFGCVADHLILFPSTDQRECWGCNRRVIDMPGGVLEIWTARSQATTKKEPEAFVLEFVGNADRAENGTQYRADRWRNKPVEAWVVNYPGYGGSTGPARLHKIPPAALTAYDELTKVAKGRPIFVAGASLGSTAALYVAANRPVAGVILHNPPPLQNMILNHHGWWNLWLLAGPVAMQIPPEMNSLNNAPNAHAPAIFLLAEKDTIVPPDCQKKVADAYAGPKKIITLLGADHNDPIDGDGVKALDENLQWLWSQRAGGKK